MRAFLYYSEMESPVGPLTLVASEKGLCRIDYGTLQDVDTKLRNWARKYFLRVEWINDDMPFQTAKEQLKEYFAKERIAFNLEYDLYGTPFQQKVWQSLTHIPLGETRSYKDIAISIQAPKAIRAVGGAINKNPLSIIYPCHRVIGSNGALVGYAGGLDKKEHLLNHEQAKAVSL
ncbi:methylated-DNA--[protein]-cysteine S-methyltransferase [Pontibacillus litoralis]|uniref:Methylated-DNA--protein-cysteine methyltransferase n=1 Tax=Pontibacillus litoralis JSM 072002 TaxID=1385512 RepID=A0A0A5G2K1_9BACI|nr:methylated-DNA--[protein]-cysteine S-methyltransferase [Pontibacillus litoralis]KGX87321.1 iron-sulfur binding protein [Pontibacillus litoralis JSM 072002]